MAPPKVTATAKVETKPAEPVKAPEKAEAKPAEKAAEPAKAEAKPADTFFLGDIGNFRVESGHGYSSAEVSNDHDPSHTGYGTDLRVGFDFNLLQSNRLHLGPEFIYSGRFLTMSSGDTTSYLNKHSFLVGGNLAYEVVPRWLHVFTGLGLGFTSIDSGEETTDGVTKGGLVYANNPLKFNVKDDKAFALQWRVGLSSPELIDTKYFGAGLNAYYQLTNSDHKLTPDSLDRSPTDPAIPVSGLDHFVGGGLVIRFGAKARNTSPITPEVKDSPAPAKKEEVKPVAVVPAGTKPEVKAVADKTAEVKADIAASLNKKHGEVIKTTAAGIDPKNANSTDKKVTAYNLADTLVKEYKASKAEYEAAAGKLAEAEKALADLPKDMSEADKKPAIDAIASAKAELEKLKADVEANQKVSLEAVQKFYSIKGLSNNQNSWATKTIAELGGKKAPAKPAAKIKEGDGKTPPPPGMKDSKAAGK